jgi:diaminopimelate epimerase
MERKIGEVFVHNGVKLEVVKAGSCHFCYFLNEKRRLDCSKSKPCFCSKDYRSDNTNIIFHKVEEN